MFWIILVLAVIMILISVIGYVITDGGEKFADIFLYVCGMCLAMIFAIALNDSFCTNEYPTSQYNIEMRTTTVTSGSGIISTDTTYVIKRDWNER